MSGHTEKTKRVRGRKQAKKRREEWNTGYKLGKKAKKDGANYGSGIALKHPNNNVGPKKKTATVIPSKNCRCGSTQHLQTSQKDCPLNKKNVQQNVQQAGDSVASPLDDANSNS